MSTQHTATRGGHHTLTTVTPMRRAEDGYVVGPDETGHYCFEHGPGGDQRAWELLIQRYEPYLMRLAASYHLGEDAHDAVQETFFRLMERGDRIRKPESLKYWLATVLRNECLNVIARRRRESPVEADNIEALLPPADRAEVDWELLRDEEVGFVRQALAKLPPRQRELLELLAHPESEGYRWLADRLEIPIGSIGPTRQRALARLREILRQMDYDKAA